MSALADLFALLVFGFALTAFYCLRSMRNKKRRVAKTLAQLSRVDVFSQQARVSEMTSITRAQLNNRLTRLPLIGERFFRLLTGFQLLGWQDNFVFRLSLLSIVGAGIGLSLAKKMQMGFAMSFLFAIGCIVALGLVLYLRAMNKYQQELKMALPEAIDAITRTCRAGVPITSAFAHVAGHLDGVIADEFKLIDHWLKLGVPLRRAMQDSANRIALPEYRFFAVILIINQEAGGALSETLERLTRTLRERHELQLKILAKTSEARASSKIVSALVPGILGYMYFNSPDDFQFLMSDPVGKPIFFYAVCSVLLGLLITTVMVKKVR